MKVAIVGGGLGGLACAIACRREEIDVEVFERAESEVGAGIQIPPNGTRIMRDLGLLPLLLEKGSQVQHVNFRRYRDGHLLRSMPFGDDITEEYGAPWMCVICPCPVSTKVLMLLQNYSSRGLSSYTA